MRKVWLAGRMVEIHPALSRMTQQLGSLCVSCAQQEKLGTITWVGEWFRFPLCVEQLDSLVGSVYHVHYLFCTGRETG